MNEVVGLRGMQMKIQSSLSPMINGVLITISYLQIYYRSLYKKNYLGSLPVINKTA